LTISFSSPGGIEPKVRVDWDKDKSVFLSTFYFVLASVISGGNKKREIESGWKFASEPRILGGEF
jgi:hypothetical protein